MQNTGRSNAAFKKRQVPVNKQDLYNQVLITKKVALNITAIGNNIKETLESEFVQIKAWITKKDFVQQHSTTSKFTQKPDNRQQLPFSLDNIQHNFQEFLNKYNTALPTESPLKQDNHNNYNKSNTNMYNKSNVYKKHYTK